jgi:hypothetical protein
MSEAKNERGLVLGIALIAVLVGLLVLVFAVEFKPGPMQKNATTVITGIYLMFWGILFLASYYFSHKCFFFRCLIWICEHFSHPSGRWMALSYFVLSFIIGGVALLTGLGLIVIE